MYRRTLLAAAATLTVAPDPLTIPNPTPPPLPIEETDEWWWGFVKRAIILNPQYYTDRYLDTAVMRSNLNHISDDEAKRVIRAAFDGSYKVSDIPEPYQD